MVDSNDVTQAYRLFLGREPQDAEVKAMLRSVPDLDALRHAFLYSAEFQQTFHKTAFGKTPDVLVHLHIPKSGGTSLNEILRNNFAPADILHIATHEMSQLTALALQERRKFKVVMGHLQYGVAAALPQKSLYIAVLREPGPRIYSFFRFIQRSDVHPLYAEFKRLNLDFGGFLQYSLQNPAVRLEIDNGQCRRLAGRMEGPTMDPRQLFAESLANMAAPNMIVGTQERFGTLLQTLTTRGLLASAENRFENVTNTEEDYPTALAALREEDKNLLTYYCYWDALLHRATDLMIDGAQL